MHRLAACLYAFLIHLNTAPESIGFGILCAACAWNWRESLHAWRQARTLRWLWPLMAWSVFASLSGFWSPEHALAKPTKAALLPWLIAPVGGAAPAMAFSFVAGAFVGMTTQVWAWSQVRSFDRIAGLGKDLSTVGALACDAALLSLGGIVLVRNFWWRVLAASGLLVSLLSLAFTQGRGAGIALLVAAPCLLWMVVGRSVRVMRGRSSIALPMVVLLVVGTVGTGILLSRGVLFDRVTDGVVQAEERAAAQTRFLGFRLLLAQLAFDAACERPLFGWGRSPSTWTIAISQGAPADRLAAAAETVPGDREFVRNLNSAHNAWLQVALEGGGVGVGLLGLAAAFACRAMFRDRSAAGSVSASVAIAWLVLSLSTPAIQLNRVVAPVMLALGVVLRPTRPDDLDRLQDPAREASTGRSTSSLP